MDWAALTKPGGKIDEALTKTGILDSKDRCYGRKPLVYKSAIYTTDGPQRFCPRCDRAYDLVENRQIPNWAWKLKDGVWVNQTRR